MINKILAVLVILLPSCIILYLGYLNLVDKDVAEIWSGFGIIISILAIMLICNGEMSLQSFKEINKVVYTEEHRHTGHSGKCYKMDDKNYRVKVYSYGNELDKNVDLVVVDKFNIKENI